MRHVRAAVILLRHAWRVYRGGQIRFRLETFGLYYPAPPYRRPVWQLTPGSLRLLWETAGAYARWVIEMEEMRKRGAQGWWARRREEHLGRS